MAKSFKSWAAQNADDDLRREEEQEEQEEEQTRPKSFKAWKQESTAPATSVPATAAVPSATPSSSPSSVPAATEQRTGFKAWRQQNGTPVPETPEPKYSTMERYRPGGVYRPETTSTPTEAEPAIETTSSIKRYRPGGVYKPETQETQPWDALYSSGAIARGKELAAQETLTQEEKQEARALQREIDKVTKTRGVAKSDKYAELTDLSARLYSKSNWFAGFGAGVIQALGFDWLTDRTADIVEAVTGVKSDTGAQELAASAQENFPVWNAAGNIAGSVLELGAISSAVSGALSKASWFAKMAPWVQRATSSAITFGLSGAANGVTEIQSKEEWDKQEQEQAELAASFGAEYTPREYSLGNQLAKVGIGAATGAASGALGGALSSAFGAGTTNILRRYGLQYNTALRAIASGITGMGFAAGSTAAQEVSKYLQYPEGYTPNAAEIGSNLAIAFLFSTASSAISEAKSAQSNKEQMLRLMDELAKEYGTAKIKMAGMVGENRVSEATRVYELSQRIREGLATSPGMSGVQEEVKALAAALDIIDDQMLAIMSGGNGLLGAADVVAESGAPAGVPLSEAIALIGANAPAPNGVPAESTPIPQAAEPATVPAWYTALMNTPRPMDQPMQQRPTLSTPTQAAPQQESQAPILPAPETATAQAMAHTGEAPAPSAPVRSEELTPEPERGIVKEEPKYSTPEGNKLAEGLKAYDKLESNGFEYTLSDTSAGWIGHLRDIRDSRMGGMISNARALDYQTQPMNTREEAVDALVQVAERNGLLTQAQETTPITPTSEAPVLPKEGETDADIAARMGVSKPLWNYTRHSSTPLYGIDTATGKSYMGDRKAVVEVDNTAESVAMQSRRYGGIGATSQDMSNILKYANRTINSSSSNPLEEQPRVLKDENGEETYIIDVWGGHLGAVGKDQARLIDGYKIIASGEEPNGGGYLVSVNEDGSIHGVTRYAKTSMSYADYKKLPKGKLNGITKAKKEKGVTNGRGQEREAGAVVGKEPQVPGEMEKGQGRLQEPASGRAGADRQASQGIVQQSNAQRADRVKQAAISPAADTIEREFVDRIKKEYGVNAYVIPVDVWEETFGVNAPELRTLRGEVYVKQGIDTDALSVGIPHEATHAMRQTKYQPYLSLLDEIPEYYNFNSPTARRFLDVVLEHIGLDSIDELSTNDYQRLYDELMAAVYGEAINGHTAGNTDYGRLDFNDIFTNFDELFTRLKKIHEDFKAWNKSRLKLPAEETLAPKTEDKAPVITAGQEGANNGPGEVDTGRPSVRGGKPGPGGPAKAGEKPEAGERVSGSGDIRHGDVQPDEGNAEQPGTRSGRSDDTLRPEQGGNAGHPGAADEQSVSGVAGENAGSAEPGLSVGADDGRGRVTKSKPRNRKNYRIAEDIDSIKPNYQDNIDAIKLMKELMETGRKATPEEMAVLAKYKGWGALKEILNEYSYWGRVLSKLVTPEEYNAAKLSTANAHYTSTKVINAMYDAVKRLGFTGGRVLEPSMGVGNFFGVMPDKLSRASELYGVELDSITGNIANLLYPDAKIDVAGFQDVLYADDTFDLVIGNVPFSNDVRIPYRGNTYNLHDFFFVKALDETKPGGIAALITSTGTLDKTETKVRRAIAARANLIASFRLPDDAFKTNAGTSVTTDLIFLQKRGNGIDDNGIAFETIGKLNDIPINEYYTQHPKNILGTLAYEKGMYPGERAVVHSNGEDMQQALSNAIKTLPKDIMNTSGEAARPVIMRKRGERKKATFVVRDDGSVEITDGTTGEVIEYGKATKKEREAAETIRDYVGLKNTFMDLLETEGRGENGTALRERLNTQYDSFVKKHGPLSDPANKKLLKPDGDYIRTTGIEVKTKDGYGKSDIFRVPTVSKLPKTHADSAEEALSITLNESGKVDIPRMAELTGKTQDEIKDDLKDEIIQTPDGDWQLVAQYASGNIYEKLDRIGDKPEYDRHRRLLEAALPRPKGADEIDASFGAHWIAPEYVKQFIDSTFSINAKVQYNKELGQWTVEFSGRPSVKRFNTDRIDAKKIIESTLNGRNVVVKDKIDDKSVINEPETKLAQSKQDELREAFREWAFKDSKRAEDLIDTFNRSLNAYAPMNYDALANRIDFGVNPASTKQPRDYQKAAAARIVFGGNTLLHNGVGTGKTLTMAIAAHALKQAGIAQKPMFVVPNGKVEDFRSEILEAYPDAKILALDNDSMTPKQIQATKSLIATGDWDYVIIYRSAFELIPLSPERAADALQRQLDLYESAARDIAGDKNGNKRFEKGLAQRVETLRNKIQELLDKPKDTSTYFDDMGIDALFVDEAHNYKKVGFPTSMQVSGIVSDTNDITTDLYMKEEYLRDRGNRIVLASATPITNTISEMYNMTMHVAPEVYRNAGIYSFDAWANTFANIESQVEIAPDGKTFRRKERVRSYKNANELFGLYRQFADIKQTKDVVENLPKAEEITVISESDDLHKQIVDYLSNMPADRILQMNNDNRAAATDLRLVTELLKEMGLDPDTMDLDLPGSKINKAVNNIVQEYKKSKDIRGTQFVFLDIGINSEGKRYHFNLYDDMINKLVNAGIPRSEIAKIGDYNDEESRQILYNKMNNGDIRVLIGSTAKMGEGVNAQQRAVALHDVSVPWRPDNLEQRHGRIVRSGNINKNVRIYRYVQEGSYDSYLWQMIERKAAYLSEAYNGGDATDMDELNDAMVSYRESKAIATGNPLIMEKMSLQDKISRLKILQRGWQKEKLDAQKTIDQYSVWKLGSEGEMKSAKADMETYKTEKAKAGDDLKITIGKKTYDNRKDATDALTPILEKKKVGPIGSLYGFTFGLTYDPQKNEYYLYTQAQGRYTNGLGDSPAGNLTRILNLVENAPKHTYEAAKRRVDYYDTGIKDAKTTLEAPFKHQKELEESQARMRVIDAELGVSGNEEEVIGSTAETSDSRDTSNFNGNTAPAHPENWKAERLGDKNKTPMSLTDIVNMIRHDFDIPVTTGNIRSPNARAQYRRQPQSIRTKVAKSIPDIAHELGHHLDNIYDIRHKISKEAKKEIVDAMPESFKSQYKGNQLPGEGVAEFLRRYLQNSETAAIDYPVFTEEFLGMLDSKGRAAIEKLADEMNAYYSLSEETGNWPIHNREDKGKDYRDFGEKLSDMYSRFRTLFIDSMEPIRQVDKAAGTNVHMFAINSAYAGNRAYAAITGDLYDLRGNYLGDGLQKALKGIRVNNKKEYTDFGWYLTCRHGPERLAEGMRVTGQDAWNNTPFMDEMVKEFEERYPEFRAAADRLYEFIANVNQIAVDAGLYSQDTMDSWMDRWHYYVPLNRWFGDTDGKSKGIKRSFANQTGPYKRAYGSGEEIINPVDNVIENTVRIITASIYNDVMKKLTHAVNKTEGLGWLMEQVPMPLARKTWDGAGLKSKTLEAFQEAFEMGGKPLEKAQEDFIQRILDEAIDDVLVQYGRGRAHGNIVTVMKGGKPEYWMINDPALLKSIANMETGRGSDLINILGRVNRFITGNITGINVVWSLASNSPRDLGTLITLSKSKNVVSLLKGILGSYVNSVKGEKADALFKEYMAMGGGSTSAQTADKNMARAARKALQKNAADWLNPLETVEFISDMIERGPRYAEYRICRTKYGMSPEEAFYAAMEVTTNFKRRGLLTGDINKLVPFFNASVQGVDRMARWLAADDIPQDKRKKARTGRIAAFLGVSAALAALGIALNTKSKKDKDNLEKLSTFTKNNYFVIPMGDGKYVAIPKPRELAIAISAFERLFETLATQNPHSFDDFWEYVTDNTLPGVVSGVAQGDLNSAIGDLGVFGSIHYLVSNQDFLGRPIVSSSLQNLEAKDQYAANTSKLAYYLGQAFNLSPQQIDFIGNEIFGGFWSWQKALIPVSAESDITLGVKGKWVKDPLYSTDITNRLYNQRDKLEKVKNSNPDNVDAAINYRTVSDMASFYGKYYKLARSEKETPQSRETRSTVLDMILGVENKAGSTERAYKFMVDACRIDGSSALMPAVMDTFVKDDNGKTYNLTSQEYFTLQTRYNSLYYNYIRAAMDKGSMSDAEKVAVLKSAKKLAGIVAKGEMLQTKGATSEDYEKIIALYGDENSDIDEGELTRFLANKSLADVDGSGSVSHAELLSAVSGLRLPTEDEIALTSYANPDLGLKLSVVSPYGVDAGDYQRVLEIAGSNPSQAKAEEAIDAVYGRTTTKNRKEKAAMWQALNKSWKAANNPYDSNVSGKVQSGLVVTAK